jgi:hypothetical protein
VTLASVTHRIPRQIIAGDSIEFLVEIPDGYEGWTGSARLSGPAQMAGTVTTEDGDFRVRFPGQATGTSGTYKTAQLNAGQYVITVWATNGDDRKTILQTPITVTPDLSTGTTSTEPHCVKMLRIIEAALEARIGGNSDGGIEGYQIDGTAITKIATDELKRLRNKYAAEVQILNNPNGQIGRVKFAMTPTGGIVDARRRFM